MWLCLRWLWPRWRDALVLIQPATVDRWRREGVLRCWRRRSRHSGRPRIDTTCRDLIQRIAAENCLWGAPRIHGELLKLGMTISERTVSRYLRGRPTTRSQTWRTFFANHFVDQISPVMSGDSDEWNVSVDASDVASFRVPPIEAAHAWLLAETAVSGLSQQPMSLGVDGVSPQHRRARTPMRTSSGRGPPEPLLLRRVLAASAPIHSRVRRRVPCGDQVAGGSGYAVLRFGREEQSGCQRPRSQTPGSLSGF